jgi:peroxiredoxin
MPEETITPDAGAASARDDEVRGLRRVIWAMFVILLVSLSVNLLLAYRIKGMSEAAAKASTPRVLVAGESVPPFEASSLGGRREVVSYAGGDRPVVLYVFSPTCSWCERNLENFKALLSQKGDAYRFVGLSVTDRGLKEYVADKRLDLPVYYDPAEDAAGEYKIGGTPQTLVISPEGKVLQNWVGAYVGPQQAEVEKFFGVRLPGVAPVK